jgi:hypothetical protein
MGQSRFSLKRLYREHDSIDHLEAKPQAFTAGSVLWRARFGSTYKRAKAIAHMNTLSVWGINYSWIVKRDQDGQESRG